MRLSLLVLLLLPVLGVAQEKKVPEDLLNGLKSKDADERVRAIRGLSKLGVEAVPPLVGALRDEEKQVSQSAAYALRILKAEPKALAEAVSPHAKDKNAAVRAGVAGALNRCGTDGLPALLKLLDDGEADVRRQAVQSLAVVAARTPAARKEVLSGLQKRVEDDSQPVRLDLARALPRCGDDSAKALLTLADDADASVRAHAIAGLGQIKAGGKEALAALSKKAKGDEDAMVRQSAVRTLGKMGRDAEPAVIASLKDKEPSVQAMALRTLAAMKPDAKKVAPLIEEVATKAESEQVRAVAVQTLERVGGEDAEKAIVRLLKRDDSAVRLACLQRLIRGKLVKKELIGDLIKALADGDADVRSLAAFALGELKGDAKEALPALRKLTDDEDERARKLAKQAIEKIEGM
jgi:HEAT repeat protein